MKTAYYNGRVYTGEMPLCEAFITENGRFTAVGASSGILSLLSDGDERVDLEGAFVCPGFIDSHMHLLGFGSSLRTARLDAHSGSLAEMLAYLRTFIETHPPRQGQWITGRGWNQDLFSDARRMPDRHDLDAVSRDIPIMLTRACGHCCVLNTRALVLAGIGSGTVSPEGGSIGKEGVNPDGRLYDNAMDLLRPVLPRPDREELRAMLRSACAEVNRYGITGVQTDDYRVFDGISPGEINDIYREMAECGELTVRVYEQAQFAGTEDMRAFVSAGGKTGTGSDMFRIGPVKILGDGSLGSRTAHLSRPYADAPDTCGFDLYPNDVMDEMIACAHENGMQIAVHAIGDACLDQVLDAFERALKAHPRTDHRHGIVHCQITRPEQLKRIVDLGLHVYAQSIFLDYDNHIVEKRAGSVLAGTSYHWKTLLDMGASVSNGSDCPVERPDVMTGIECAVTRTSLDGTGPYLKDQAFTVKEAIDSFTMHGAHACFDEHIRGRIRPGHLADFTALEKDPFDTAPRDLHRIRVTGCWVSGKKVYSAQ